MAEIRDIRSVLREMGLVGFSRKVWREVGDDNLFTWASALAYSWLFAIFPFFLVLLSLIPLLRYEWRVEAKTQITHAIDQLPHEAKVTVYTYLAPRLDALLFFDKPKAITGIWSIGLLLTIWAASGGMTMTMSAMDRCYDVERVRPFYKQRPLAVMLTLIVASLILSVVVLIPVGTLVTNYLTSGTERLLEATRLSKPATPGDTPREAAATLPATTQAAPGAAITAHIIHRPGLSAFWIVLWQIGRYALALMFMFWVVGLIYHFGPNVKQKFRLFTPGAMFTVAIWVLLGLTFRIYIDRFGKYGETYGAVGGVIILLFFFYVDALVLLIGAEINSEIDAAIRTAAKVQEKPPPPAEMIDTEPAQETP
ncbi:MAG: YihY/virulence factor BrkB family protein [Tepidisphaeraceae bacterium]